MPKTSSEWSFWFVTVVVVSLLVNIAASYLKPYLDRRLERRSNKRRERNKDELEMIDYIACWMMADPAMVSYFTYEVIKIDMARLLFLIIGIVLAATSMNSDTENMTVTLVTGGLLLICGVGFITLGRVNAKPRAYLDAYHARSLDRFNNSIITSFSESDTNGDPTK